MLKFMMISVSWMVSRKTISHAGFVQSTPSILLPCACMVDSLIMFWAATRASQSCLVPHKMLLIIFSENVPFSSNMHSKGVTIVFEYHSS